MADVAADRGRGERFEGRRDENRPAARSAPDAAGSGGFFNIYKPGQGYHTRIWTGVATGILICWFAYFLYEKLELVADGTTRRYVQVGVTVATILSLGLVTYWLLALNRKVCDFLIATEGEMKKVNWTSRKEIIGSTKVVITVVVVLSVMLFIVDTFFILFFNGIGVLKAGGLLESVKELF